MDIIYLGIFCILSPAFDVRFWPGAKGHPNLIEEVSNAVFHFHSLLRIFRLRFIVVLEGELVRHSYIFDRMLGEFAAAAVGFSKAIDRKDDGESFYAIATQGFVGIVEGILQVSHPSLLPYFSRCLDRNHKSFSWTGPKLQILPRSDEVKSMVALSAIGELLELPSHKIYDLNLDSAELGKRHSRDDDLINGRPGKRRREPQPED